jgi:hypothetical protein
MPLTDENRRRGGLTRAKQMTKKERAAGARALNRKLTKKQRQANARKGGKTTWARIRARLQA